MLVVRIAVKCAAVVLQGIGSAPTIVLQGQRKQIIAILEGKHNKCSIWQYLAGADQCGRLENGQRFCCK